MDTKTPIRFDGTRPARAPVASALCALALFLALPPAEAGTVQQEILLYTRLTGVPPTAAILSQIQAAAGNDSAVAALAVQQPSFYNVTLRNIFAAESNRDGSVFVPLNDYIATAIGMVRDDVAYNTALSADILYTVNGTSPISMWKPTLPRPRPHSSTTSCRSGRVGTKEAVTARPTRILSG